MIAFPLIVGSLLLIGWGGARYDRIIVWIIRRARLPVFPTATGIAFLIREHPDQWTAGTHHLTHPQIGAIWTANAAYGTRIETPVGTWEPNAIERRIIRDAVDWRIGDYLRDRIGSMLR